MLARLLTKAAVLLATLVGQAAIANEPGMETEKLSKSTVLSVTGAVSAEEPANANSAAKSILNVGRNPRIVLITSNESEQSRRELERLRKAGGEFAAMQSQGWKIGPDSENHLQIVDHSQAEEILKQLEGTDFPVVACISDGEIIRSFKDGCSTPLDAWTFGWMLKGINERPQAAIPEAIRVATTGSYPLRGGHWSVDGDTNPTKATLVSHLRSPTHITYLNASWKIEDWSTEELRSLHDDLHEKYGPPAASAAVAPVRQSLPDGTRKALGK